MFAFGFEVGSGGGEGSFELEGGEGAVDVAAGVDALDYLLAEVAAFAEVEGAGFGALVGGLLGEVFGGVGVADVDAVAGGALEDAEGFEGFGVRCECACGGKSLCELRDGGGIGPEFEAGDERRVSVDQIDGGRVPCDMSRLKGIWWLCGDIDVCQEGCRVLACEEKACAVFKMSASSTSSMMMKWSRWAIRLGRWAALVSRRRASGSAKMVASPWMRP